MSNAWLYRKDGRRGDVVTLERLRQMVSSGMLGADDEIFVTQRDAWVRVAKIRDLAALLPERVNAEPAAESPAPVPAPPKPAKAKSPAPVAAAPAPRQAAPKTKTRSAAKPRKLMWVGGAAAALLILGVLLGPSLFRQDEGEGGLLAFIGVKSEPDAALYKQQIQPLLTKYCEGCHGTEKQKADLDFTQFASRADVQKDRKLWRTALDMVANGEMPPEKAKLKPTTEEIDLLTAWIDRTIKDFDCSGDIDPGRVTLRRLNRTEYNHTIRDLVGVDFQPAKDFPSDDVDGEGFDNNGDVLSMPPILMEKYLSAAEDVMAKAIVVNTKAVVETHLLDATQFKGYGGVNGSDLAMGSSGEAFAEINIDRPGRYQIRTWAWAQQAGPEKAKIGVSLAGKRLKDFDIHGEHGKPGKVEFEHALGKGTNKIGIAFLNDFYQPEAKDPAQRDRNLFLRSVELIGPLDAKPPSLPDSHIRLFVDHPDRGTPKRDAARKIIEAFATQAFRRPVESQEVDKLLTMFDLADRNKETFERSVQLALTGALINPYFLFRVEQDRPGKGEHQAYALNDWEIASRLSYFLWSSMPDDALFAAAREGKLGDPVELERQVKRMLADPKSRALVDNFAAQWLQLRDLYTIKPDEKIFPEFKDDLRRAMYEEVAAHFEHVMRADRPILELLDADYTFVNERLAKHYGMSGVSGEAFQKVSVDRTQRGGLLTAAGVLTLTSDPTRSSPVKRGKWVLMNVLGTPPPPPPPVVPDLEEAEKHAGGKKLSMREKMALHSTDPICASCHKRMDPLGFGLENFDALGRWRSEHDGTKIDASGVLPDGSTFNGPAELRTVLAGKKDQFVHCITEKMLIYALGRGLEYTDACSIKGITDALAKDEYRFSSLVLAITRSVPFGYRRPMKTVEVTLND